MADLIGDPYLVTWQGSTLRLFRRSAGVFVQLDSASSPLMATSLNKYPRPAFTPDDRLITGFPSGSNIGVVLSEYLTGDLSTTVSYNFGGGNSDRRYDLMPIATPHMMPDPWNTAREAAVVLLAARYANVGTGSVGTQRNLWFSIFGSGGGGYNVNPNWPSSYSPSESSGDVEALISPDGEYLSYINSVTIAARKLTLENLGGATTPWGSTDLNSPQTGGYVAHQWSDDSSIIAAVAGVGKLIHLFSRVGTTFVKQSEIIFAETPLSVSMFGPFVAVGLTYNDGTTKYRTRIYRRAGYELVPLVTLEDIGGDVLFTKAGDMLIDVVTKKAYLRDGNTFTADHGAMTNIQAGTAIGALSPHVNSIYAIGSFYSGVAADLIEDDIDLGTLKLLLLDDGASFNPTHTTVAQVTLSGAEEIDGNNWPDGGVSLTNVTRVKEATGVRFTADNVSQEIFGGNITAYAALIYAGTRPLIFIDFATARTVEQNSLAEIDLESGFALIST